MNIHASREAFVWGRERAARMLALGLLLLVLAAGLLLMARPAAAADTFIVDQKADASDINIGDGDCDVSSSGVGFNCSLRAAIQEANATPDSDLIRFFIQDGTSGVKTLDFGSSGLGALPPITNTVTIDGYTQPGASPNTRTVGDDAALKIRLLGTGARGGDAGLEITTVSGNCVIKGLIIENFTQGIMINGDSLNNRIEGNFLGINPFAGGTEETGQGNAVGVSLFNAAAENTIGGTTPASRNVISGNVGSGISIDIANGNLIQGNYIGTDPSGTKPAGNGSVDNAAVSVEDSTGNVIGGTTPAARNVISGNFGNAIDLVGGADQNRVIGNRIGTTASGTGDLGNQLNGVAISGSPDNLIGDGTPGGTNTIAFNASNGVRVAGAGSTGNEISRNSIFSNDSLGIDLRGGFENGSLVTANDPGDVDTGPNRLQNFPVLASAKTSSTRTTIAGKLNSTPGKTFDIQFYSNPSGNEDKKFIGEKSVSTDANGAATFTFSPSTKVSAGQTVTATATGPGKNTSEFSAPKTVALASGSALAPETTKLSGPSGTTKNPAAHFKFASSDPKATFECSLDGGTYYECS